MKRRAIGKAVIGTIKTKNNRKNQVLTFIIPKTRKRAVISLEKNARTFDLGGDKYSIAKLRKGLVILMKEDDEEPLPQTPSPVLLSPNRVLRVYLNKENHSMKIKEVINKIDK